MAWMTPALPTPHTLRAPLHWSAWLWGSWLVATLLWDSLGADLWVMHWLGNAQGFALRDHWGLSKVLHTGARQAGLALYLLVWVMVLRPQGMFKELGRTQRLQAAVGVTVAVLAVNLIKRASLTSCPWALQDFGGAAQYVSHWRWGVADGGAGQCFPGGHASSALAFLALTPPWLTAPEVRARRRGLRLTGWIVGTGLMLGGVQTLRGAHYPSHTAWTALVCAAAAWGTHGLWTLSQRHRHKAQNQLGQA